MSSSLYQGVVQNDQRIHTESYDSSIGSCRRNYPPHKPWYTEYRNTTTRWYSPHGRVGAGITCTPGTAISGFAPRACGGWDAGGGRRASGRIRPTGVWGLGALLPPIPVGVDSPHGRVGAGTTRHLIHPTGVRGLGRNTQKHRRIHPTGVRGLGIGCRTPVAAAYSPNGRVGAGNTSSASAKFCGFTPRVCGVYG